MSRPSILLFVTRKFPPSTGGMETLSRDIAAGLRETTDVEVIALGQSQLHLIWFVPAVVVRILLKCITHESVQVLFGDSLAYAVIRPFIPRACTRDYVIACGLDVTWPQPIYQRLVRRSLQRADTVLPISQATADEVRNRGVSETRIRTITLGVAIPSYGAEAMRSMSIEARNNHGVSDNDLLILSVGRLVERKGMHWFIEHVSPLLDDNIVLLIAGDGSLRSHIQQLVDEVDSSCRIAVLGRVSDKERDQLLAAADVFVMPNLPVAGDMEGFGLAAPEAAMFDTVVVASRLEGLKDAIVDGETGRFCPSGNPEAFASIINELARDVHATRSLAAAYGEVTRRIRSREAMANSIQDRLSDP